MRFRTCGCASVHLVRLERSWWMRLWRGKRLYFCTLCRAKFLISRPPNVHVATL